MPDNNPDHNDTATAGSASPAITRYTRFVLLSAARTGSNMLAALLNDSPEITCFRELFNQPAGFIEYGVDGYDPYNESDRTLRDSDFESFLQQRVFGEHPSGIRAVGFKMPYEHFFWFPEMQDWLAQESGIRILHLRRRNLLRQFASLRVAQSTGGWVEEQPFSLAGALRLQFVAKAVRHPLKAATALQRLVLPRLRPPEQPAWKAQREPVTLPIEECRYYFEWAAATASKYDELFQEHACHTVTYEDIVQQRGKTLSEVQTFLDVKPRRLIPATRRQNPEPLSELIANYEELRDAFQGTEFETFFD